MTQVTYEFTRRPIVMLIACCPRQRRVLAGRSCYVGLGQMEQTGKVTIPSERTSARCVTRPAGLPGCEQYCTTPWGSVSSLSSMASYFDEHNCEPTVPEEQYRQNALLELARQILIHHAIRSVRHLIFSKFILHQENDPKRTANVIKNRDERTSSAPSLCGKLWRLPKKLHQEPRYLKRSRCVVTVTHPRHMQLRHRTPDYRERCRSLLSGMDIDLGGLAETDWDHRLPPPAAKKVVENLPKVTVTAKQADAGLKCPVCLLEFEEDETVRQLPCEHLFHSACILPWLGKTNSCPLCRDELLTDSSEYEEYKQEKVKWMVTGGADEQPGRDMPQLGLFFFFFNLGS
ncbi:unnamed protein product [Ranitomeya imitator]|uniref:E3 ubiquitin-protein ligase RNF181 n=1 Tax=Ranitomeya imitator TaxID=111125 RepID=A0ABN9LR11_9NEOB|nr:unnamed protein product [Ranitomeya imitator]